MNRTITTQKTFFVTLLLLSAFTAPVLGQNCTMICNNHVNVSLGPTCQGAITYDAVLEDANDMRVCNPNGPSAFKIEVYTKLYGTTTIPTSPVVTGDYVGKTLYVKAKHWYTGNSCWTPITVFDGAMPTLEAPADVTISCTESPDTSLTGRPFASDCSSFSLTFSDQEVRYDCGNPVKIITRTWRATDRYGNERTDEQIIRVIRATVNDVVFPPNRDGMQAPALSCESYDLRPEKTGFPMVNGKPLTNGNACQLSFTYKDQNLQSCSGTFKVLRTWTVVDWCGSGIRDYVQLIKVEDAKPPVISCPPVIQAGTSSSLDCAGNIQLPAISVSDACSNPVIVTIQTPYGTVTGNGGIINGVPVGIYKVTYNATDNCGNKASCNTTLRVEDDDAPTVVCEEFTFVSLTNPGQAIVNAQTFDDGSSDNCCLSRFEVKRMEQPDSDFKSTLTFTCADRGQDVRVVMRAVDSMKIPTAAWSRLQSRTKRRPASLAQAM